MQVIQGKVADRAAMEARMERFLTDCAPGAIGWLGFTHGFADDGTFVLLARFESEDASRRNAARPEDQAWWRETEKLFGEKPTVVHCPDVKLWLQGGSDDAGFVQVIEGHSVERGKMVEHLDRYSDRFHELRPDIIGATISSYGDNGYIECVYFTSEPDARRGEAKRLPDDMAADMREDRSLMGPDLRYLDIHEPHMATAPGLG